MTRLSDHELDLWQEAHRVPYAEPESRFADIMVGDALCIEIDGATCCGTVFEITDDGGIWVETDAYRLRFDAEGNLRIRSRVPERAKVP